MPVDKAFADKVHKCLLNDQEALKPLFSDERFTAENIEKDMLIDVVSRGISNELITPFVKVANEEQLALLVSLVVLYGSVYPIGDIFSRMKQKSETIEKYQLKPLFLTACDRGNIEQAQAMVDHGCLDRSDTRPFVVVCRNEMAKTVVNTELVKFIFKVFPGLKEEANYLSTTCVPLAKGEKTQTIMAELLKEYSSA